MNVLTRVPKLLRLMPSIKKINLYDNMIMDSGLQSLYQSMLSYPNIKSIDIGCNDLSDGSIMCIMDTIKNTHVTKLQIGYRHYSWQANHFSREGLSQIISMVSQTNKIECFGMNGVIVGRTKRSPAQTPLSEYFAELLQKATNLKTLDASHLEFNESDQDNLYYGFSKNSTLHYLNLSGNNFGQGTRTIEGISKIQSLVYLNLSSCKITSQSCSILANALQFGWSLISLDLSNNKVNSNGASHLFTTLARNQTLVFLNLSNNSLDSSIGPALKKFLVSNKVLSSLDLSKNHLSDPIALAFAESFPENESLTDLNLSSCWITDEGAIEMAKTLAHNTTMKRLTMRDNFLSNAIGYHIIDTLKINTILLWVDFTSNHVDAFALDALMCLCKRNKVLLKERKYLPLRKELIRLSIQKSKIPNAEAYLQLLTQRRSDLEEKNDQLDSKIINYKLDTESTLQITMKEIADYKSMIEEETKSIEEMKNEIENMKRRSTKFIKELNDSQASDQKKYDELVAEADKVDKETKEIREQSAEEQAKIKEEIAEIEKLLEQIRKITSNKENYKSWKIPEFPDLSKISHKSGGSSAKQSRRQSNLSNINSSLSIANEGVELKKGKKANKSSKKKKVVIRRSQTIQSARRKPSNSNDFTSRQSSSKPLFITNKRL